MVVHHLVKVPLLLAPFLSTGIATFLLDFCMTGFVKVACDEVTCCCSSAGCLWVAVYTSVSFFSRSFIDSVIVTLNVKRTVHKQNEIMLVSLSLGLEWEYVYVNAHIYPVLTCEHMSNLAFCKIIFCPIHYIQPSENTYSYCISTTNNGSIGHYLYITYRS